MKANIKKNSSPAKKLIPAAGSLLISAAMLGTSTFAWFTMSREVEVKNIQMTATVPEDIQISLGTIGGTNATAATKESEGYTLAKSTGVLVKNGAGENDTANDGAVKAPTNDWDWANTADISQYYAFGKLIPASSTDGANIYFTPDANGVGKTVRSDATYIKADGGTPGGAGATQSGTGADTTKTFKTTMYAFTNKDSKTWGAYSNDNTTGYQQSKSYNDTKDDGYYVDIPVWLRTSSTEGASINVEAYVTPLNKKQKNNTDGEALYRAVRVALLNPTQVEDAASVTPTGLLPVADGWTVTTTDDDDGTLKTNPFAGTSILDWYNGSVDSTSITTDKVVAVKAAGTLEEGEAYATNIYGKATVYKAGTEVVKLTAGTGTEYGVPTKVIIRVWLEGEDKDCWNDTAGQDWSINLKFNNGTSDNKKDIAGNATTPTP